MADLNWGTHTALAVTLASSLPPSRLPSIKHTNLISPFHWTGALVLGYPVPSRQKTKSKPVSEPLSERI